MPIRYDRFLGLYPKLENDRLPPGAAAFVAGTKTCENVDPRSGALRPLAITGSTYALHGTGGMNAGVPKAAITAAPATAPSAPTRGTVSKKCQPGFVYPTPSGGSPTTWLKLEAYAYEVHLDTNGDTQVDEKGPLAITWGASDVKFNQTGFTIAATLARASYSLDPGVTSDIYGPVIRAVLTQDADGSKGGPDAAVNVPETPGRMDPIVPGMQIPLWWSPGGGVSPRIYAYLSIRDIRGCPSWTREGITLAEGPYTWNLAGGAIFISFDLNYVEQAPQALRFVSAFLKDDETYGRLEGPYSDASDEIIVYPGEVLKLNLGDLGTNDAFRLYGTAPGGSEFYLIEDLTDEVEGADAWTWTEQPLQNEALPLKGTWADSGAADLEDDFLPGSFIHPGQFAVAFYGKTVYLSEPYKYHVFPAEYAVEMPETVVAIALSGAAILVFTTTSVWVITSSNPAYPSYRRLSDQHPLLNTLSLCQIGERLYYVTHDGLAEATGGGVRIISGQQFTRAAWTSFWTAPANVKESFTADGAVFLENGTTGQKAVFWLGEGGVEAVAMYSAITGGALTFRTGTQRFERPIYLDYIRLVYSGTVTVKLIHDGGTATISTGLASHAYVATTVATPTRTAAVEVTVAAGGVLQEIELYERQVVQMDGPVLRLTHENVPVLEDVWLRLGEAERLALAVLTTPAPDPTHADQDATLDILNRAGASLVSGPLTVATNGVVILPRGATLADMVRVKLSAPMAVTGLDLYRRQNVTVGGALEILNPDGGVAPWLYQNYAPGTEVVITGLHVFALAYTNLYLHYFVNGATSPTDSINLSGSPGDRPIRLDPEQQVSLLALDFRNSATYASSTSLNHMVYKVVIHARTVRSISPDGPVVVTHPMGDALRFPERGRWAAVSAGVNGSTALALYFDGSGSAAANSSKTLTTGAGGGFARFSRALAECALTEVSAISDAPIDHITLYPRTIEPVQQDIHFVSRDTGVQDWVWHDYEYVGRGEPSSVMVEADSYTNLDLLLFKDGKASETPDQTVELDAVAAAARRYELPLHTGQGTEESRYVAFGVCSRLGLQFQVNGADVFHTINEGWIFGKRTEVVAPGGVIDWAAPPFRMRHVKFTAPGRLACGMVWASASATVNVIHNGVIVETVAVSAGTPFLFTRGADQIAEADELVIDIACTGEIYRAMFWPFRRERVGRTIQLTKNEQGIPAWWYTILDLTEADELASGYVKGATGTLNFYADGGGATVTKAVSDGTEWTAPAIGRASDLVLDLGGTADLSVTEILLFCREVIDIPNSGIILRRGLGRKNWRNVTVNFPEEGGSFGVARVVMKPEDYAGTPAAELTLTPVSGIAETISPTDASDQKLSMSLARVRRWNVDLAHAGDVEELHLIGLTRIEFDGDAVTIPRGEGPWSWQQIRLIAAKLMRFTCVQVIASSYGAGITFRLYREWATSPIQSALTITSNRMVRLGLHDPAWEWGFDAVEPAGVVIEKVCLAANSERLGR
ncbi:MAG TPA: hypothetical protein PLG73_02460 [Candidatus Sumerlaeota bacterium]|nr:hypothetical protein [Candidatus Sumerlaeota bacterium]